MNYWCETWSLTLREYHTQTEVVYYRLLMRMFGSKRGKMTGGWRKLNIEVLQNLYSLLSIVRMI
jgi:hypothetical protein